MGDEQEEIDRMRQGQVVVQKRIGERVRNKTGRVDVLASLLADELVKQARNPVLEAVHRTVMPGLIDPLLHYYLGPRNRVIRKVAKVVRTVAGEMKRQRLAKGREEYRKSRRTKS